MQPFHNNLQPLHTILQLYRGGGNIAEKINDMSKRARLTNETLNRYGTWLLTAGGDIAQFERNPVLLYMHQRGQVIGIMKDILVENDEVTAEPEFDCATELSRTCKAQYKFGSLRMFSVSIDIIEMSDDPKFLKPGQVSPTITKWKLTEVSLVDIGANDDAIRLSYKGKTLTLAAGDNPLPKLITTKNDNMEIKQVALMLGLPDTATEADVKTRIAELMAQEAEAKTLRDNLAQMTLSAITTAVETAIDERRITADKKDQFIQLGQKVGIEDLKNTLAAMSPAVKVSTMINQASGSSTVTYAKLSEVPADALALMRKEDPEQYKKLYKAEYGFDCQI